MSDASPAPARPTDHDGPAPLDSLVEAWLTLPDVAEELGTDVGKVRRLVAERELVGVKRGERKTFQVPAAFLVTTDEDGTQVLAALRGTVLVLSDAGLPDVEILRWLFEPEPSIGTTPIEALRAGRKHEVRRVAQTVG
ncbi:Rv2175c family DNA-binding protein [Isoptericola hypogeus]|uniref:Rv2175c family DNA-binding protein n=1 Tax=Isoptericola hypogeus TaxID=300179 RepID=A0ABN2JUS8_9MICO